MEITPMVVLATMMDTSVVKHNCYMMMGGAVKVVMFGVGDIYFIGKVDASS